MPKTSRRPAPDQLPLAWHPPKKICHHWTMYRITCDQYDAMHWRAQGRCEICRCRPEDVQKTPLGVDHDHRLGNTFDHVRGLLCAKCNRAMCYVDNGYRQPTPEQQRYIDQAWYHVWLPPELRDEFYSPPPPSNPSSSTRHDETPAERRKRTIGWVFRAHPNCA